MIRFAIDITESELAAEQTRDASSVVYSTPQQTVDIAARGADSLRTSIETSDQIRDLIADVKSVIGDLNDESKNIETIVAIISAGTNPTNLLALNAAIEAARTSAATGEVAEVIHGNLDYTGDIAQRIENASRVADLGREQVRSVETIVDEIREGASHVLDSVYSIPRG